jgi:hypothetical protein
MWWGERNTIRTGGQQRPAAMIAHAVHMYVAELMKYEETSKLVKARVQGRWLKQPMGKLKLNCDAAFSPTTHSGGWGFVIKDADGDMVTAGWGRVDFLIGAFQAEVIACVQASKECKRP